MNMKDKLVSAGLYKYNPSSVARASDRLNGFEQHNGYGIPVYDQKKEKYFLVDTYKLRQYSTYEELVKDYDNLFEKGSHAIIRAYYDYYYNTSPEINEYNLHQFELVADLHEYNEVSYEEYTRYRNEDKYNAYIAHERSYPYGSHLVKVGAKPSLVNDLRNALSDTSDYIEGVSLPEYKQTKLANLIEEAREEGLLAEAELKHYEDKLKIIEKRNQLEQELKDFIHSL